MMLGKATTQIDTRTRDILRAAGSKGESYDDMILELVELREAFVRDLYRILDETPEGEWIPLDDFDLGGPRMTLLLSPQFQRDVQKLSESDRRRIKPALLELRNGATGDARKVWESLWRLRVGDYRVYYSVGARNTCVIRVMHRRQAHRSETIRSLLKRVAAFEEYIV